MIRAPGCVLLLAAVALAQQPGPGLPDGVAWQSVEDVPAWVEAPAAGEDRFRFTTVSQSNLPEIAASNAPAIAERSGKQLLFDQFAPVLPADVATVLADAAWQRRKLVAAAQRFQVGVGRGPGNSIATAWLHWEVPVRATIDTIAPELRGRAERALLRPPLAWQQVTAAPGWVEKPPLRDDWFRLVLVREAEWDTEARAALVGAARDEVQATLIARTREVLGDEIARAAAAAAIDDLQPVHKASWFRRLEPPVGKQRRIATAWALWEVPVARLLEHVPAERHAAVRAALAKP
ncbi:MAG: hypothetical protein IPK26_08800 [Planctomycetes bacterium]|nr:hypothetical protein [Planctomycetota bacterium]